MITSLNEQYPKPFVKWAGGKRQLISQFTNIYPSRLSSGSIDTYVEPFLGGGAVLFDLISKYKFKRIIVNDINPILIQTYICIRDYLPEFVFAIEELKVEYHSYEIMDDKNAMFLRIRKEFNYLKNTNWEADVESKVKICSYFMFLNKTCFNGLYRENKKGEFNVSFGKSVAPAIYDYSDLLNTSRFMQNIEFYNLDFEDLLSKFDVNSKMLIYFDPPYRPVNSTSNFNSYSKANFTEKDQIRLAKTFREMNDKGAYLMLSNSNPSNINSNDTFFSEYYHGFDIEEVSARRVINSNSAKRGAISEVLVNNRNQKEIW
jgi:DNA adenine methylase